MDLIEQLKASFPDEALSNDDSRGFDLTSIKPQYIIERLNDVIGIGNWSLDGKWEINPSVEYVMYYGHLTITLPDNEFKIETCGGAKVLKDRFADAHKSARTDALSKAASHIMIGNDVFKGLVKVGKKPKAGKSNAIEPYSPDYLLKTGRDKGKSLSIVDPQDLANYAKWGASKKAQGDDITGPLLNDMVNIKEHLTRNPL